MIDIPEFVIIETSPPYRGALRWHGQKRFFYSTGDTRALGKKPDCTLVDVSVRYHTLEPLLAS